MRQKILEDSVSAIRQALENFDLPLLNIFANRLMADASFLDNKLVNLFAMSLKNLIDPCNMLQNLSSDKEETKTHLTRYLLDFVGRFSNLVKEFEEKSMTHPIDTYWVEYYNIWNKILKDTVDLSDFEDHYTQDPNYTHKYILHMLKNNIKLFDTFRYRNRMFLNGIINEIQRLYKNFGINLNDFILYNYLIMLDRTIDGIIFENMNDIFTLNEDQMDVTLISDKIKEFSDPLAKLLEEPEFSTEIFTNKIHELIILWRNNFIRYQNFEKAVLPQVIKEHRKKIQIPEEVQNKIDALVQKSMYKK